MKKQRKSEHRSYIGNGRRAEQGSRGRCNAIRCQARLSGMRCLLVATVLLATLAACADSPESGRIGAQPPTTSTSLRYFDVPTNHWHGGARQQAHLYGVLHFTSKNCPFVVLDGGGPGRIWPSFPSGARGVITRDGMRLVVDREDRVYGAEGEKISMSGGGTHPTAVIAHGCGPGPRGSTFSIQDDPINHRLGKQRARG